MNDRKSESREASTSRESFRYELVEDGSWTNIIRTRSKESLIESPTLSRDATSSYSTNRETVYHNNVRTVEETHLIKSSGSTGENFTEEHWSSEIKSFVTAQPPKFIQVIKAYRVLATDILTIVVEVSSDPPAIFEWFCNDRSVQQDRRKFKVRHGINITTLTIEGPEQGVYKCTARNPAGLSTTYGYINVSAPSLYKNWIQQKHVLEEDISMIYKEELDLSANKPPRFVNQVPNLTLRPGFEAVIDVQVDAFPPTVFTWYVNGVEQRNNVEHFHIYYPKENRCIAQFSLPQSGEYKVIAENILGKDQSVGYIDIKKEVIQVLTHRPPLPGDQTRRIFAASDEQNPFQNVIRASSVTKTIDIYEESSYYQRSSSLPRPIRSERQMELPAYSNDFYQRKTEEHPESHHSSLKESRKKLEDDQSEIIKKMITSRSETKYLPQTPIFVNKLPEELKIAPNESLMLTVDVNASPQADIKWNINGFEIRSSKNITVLNEKNRSTLVVQPPVKLGRYTVCSSNHLGIASSTTYVSLNVDESFQARGEVLVGDFVQKPPEIVENAVVVKSMHEDFEIIDKISIKSSSDSYETVKMLDSFTTVAPEENKDVKCMEIGSSVTADELLITEELSEARRMPISSQRQPALLPKRPFIIKQLEKEMRIKAGESLRLETEVDSYPESKFTWFLNNFQVKQSENVHIDDSKVNQSKAKFDKPTDGIYKVVASNEHGSSSSSTRVITEITEEFVEESLIIVEKTLDKEPKYKLTKKMVVKSRKDLPSAPKIIEKLPPTINAAQGDELTFSVRVDANPEAKITWLLNKFELRSGATIHIENATNVSRITLDSPVDGRLEALASNELGKDTCSTKIIVDNKRVESISFMQSQLPVFIEALPAEMMVNQKESIELYVKVHSEKYVTFRWFVDGNLIASNLRYEINETDRTSSLLAKSGIDKPTVFAVEVSNPYGTIWCETNVKLNTTYITEISESDWNRAPCFIKQLQSATLKKGEQFSASVSIKKSCAPSEFAWYIDNRDLRTLPGVLVESNAFDSTLKILNASHRTEGELMVRARNKYGSATSICTISMEETEVTKVIREAVVVRPPKVISPLHSSSFISNIPMKLQCRIDAYPPPDVIWTLNGVKIDATTSEHISTRISPDGLCELVNVHPSCDNTGFYQCIASNLYGTAETAAYISVEDRLYEQAIVEQRRVHDISEFGSEVVIAEQRIPVEKKLVTEMETLIEEEIGEIELRRKIKPTLKVPLDVYDKEVTITRERKDIIAKDDEMIKRQVRLQKFDDIFEEKQDFIAKAHKNTSVQITATEVMDSQESYSRTAELKRNEEEYKLLVKVAVTVAQTLVAKVVIDEAIREAVSKMKEVHSSDEEDSISYNTADDRPCAPRFETNIECFTVEVGGMVKLATDISGYPTPKVEWYFGEQRMEQSSQTELCYVNGRATLTIKNVTKAHEGTYQCRAINEYGKAVLSCILRVLEPESGHIESVLDFSKQSKYVSETEAEVSTNVHVRHFENIYEQCICILHPEIITLGYDCLASTSEAYDDSLIITAERVLDVIDKRYLETKLPKHESFVALNLSIEKPTTTFTHLIRILQPDTERTGLLSKESRILRRKEIMQTTDIEIFEKQEEEIYASTVNTFGSMVIEKAPQKQTCQVLYTHNEKIVLPEEKFYTVPSSEMRIKEINEILSTVLFLKENQEAYEVTNVDVRRPSVTFEHSITIIETQIANASLSLSIAIISEQNTAFDITLSKDVVTADAQIFVRSKTYCHSVAEQHIIILESSTRILTDSVTWNLRKIEKALSKEMISNINVEARKPSEKGEFTSTVIDSLIASGILNLAASTSKLKLTSIYINLTRKEDVAHQTVVIEFESVVEDEATLNVAFLTAPGFTSKEEYVWSREVRCYGTSKSIEKERNVVAVFVEVEATCPDQSVELVASVSTPLVSNVNLFQAHQSISSADDHLFSVSESSSTGNVQVPKFIKSLQDDTATVGHSYRMKCIISGSPVPEIKWFVDGDEITDSNIYETVYEDGVCILKIKDVVAEDEGEYICQAVNTAGQTTTKCFLKAKTSEFGKEGNQEFHALCVGEQSSSHFSLLSNEQVDYPHTMNESYQISETFSTVQISFSHFNLCDNKLSVSGFLSSSFFEEQCTFSSNIEIAVNNSFFALIDLKSNKECQYIINISEKNIISCSCKVGLTHNAAIYIHFSRLEMEEEARIIKLYGASVNELEEKSIQLLLIEPWEELMLRRKSSNACVPICLNVFSNETTKLRVILDDGPQDIEVSTNVEFSMKNHHYNTVHSLPDKCFLSIDETIFCSHDKITFEPRSLLLPQKITYKGQEVEVSIKEIRSVLVDPDKQTESDNLHTEAVFDFISTISSDEIRIGKVMKTKAVVEGNIRHSEYEPERKQSDSLINIGQLNVNSDSIPQGMKKWPTKSSETIYNLNLFKNAIIENVEYEFASYVNSENNQSKAVLSTPRDKISIKPYDNSRIMCKSDDRSGINFPIEVKEIEHIAKQPKILQATSSTTNDICNKFQTTSLMNDDHGSDDEVNAIERAIFEISDRIAQQQPVTEAQAEASEELLRATLEEMIIYSTMNKKTDNITTFKKPIAILREEIMNFEKSLTADENNDESMSRKYEENYDNLPYQFDEAGKESLFKRLDNENDLKKMNSELSRLTPITSSIQERLLTLELMLDEENPEEVVDQNFQDFDKKQSTVDVKSTITKNEFSAKHHRNLQNTFLEINNEINVLRHFCHKNISKKGADAIIRVLHKVANRVTSIVETFTSIRKKSQKEVKERHIPKSGFFFKSNASINFNLIKKEAFATTCAVVICKKNGNHVKSNNQNIKSSSTKTIKRSYSDDNDNRHIPPHQCKDKYQSTNVPAPQLQKDIITLPITDFAINLFLKPLSNHKATLVSLQCEAIYSKNHNNLLMYENPDGIFKSDTHFGLTSSIKNITSEFVISREADNTRSFIILPIRIFLKCQYCIFDETCSVKLSCEESDYGTDTDTAPYLFYLPSNFSYKKQVNKPGIIIDDDKHSFDTCSLDYMAINEVDKKATNDNKGFSDRISNGMSVDLSGNSDYSNNLDIHFEFDPHYICSSMLPENINDPCISSTNYEECEAEKDTPNPHVLSLTKIPPIISCEYVESDVGFLTAIIEDSEYSEYKDPRSVNDLKVALTTVKKQKSLIANCEEQGISDSVVMQLLNEVNLCTNWLRRPQKYKIKAVFVPECKATVSLSADTDDNYSLVNENTYMIDVEQVSQSYGCLIKIADEITDYALSSFDLQETTKEMIKKSSLNNELNNEYLEEADIDSSQKFSFGSSTNSIENNERNTGVSVSIIARSVHDIIYASLEEIPWGEVSIRLLLPDMSRSLSLCNSEAKTNSLIQNITVSELNENENKSLRSQESLASSQRSLDEYGRADRFNSNQSLNIPHYLLKEGTTATITCEFNNFLSPGSIIEWYKGTKRIEVKPGKVDRISHDLLEVLVIAEVEMSDNDIYSIKVNDDMYPVAFLIIEEEEESEKLDDGKFLSPPQTLFVMEGQPAIICCQVNGENQEVVWCKDKKLIETNNRIRVQSDKEGNHKILISQSQLDDQGTYFAFLENHFTTITLVVEERIDEKEVTVTASGTESEDDELREYIVPPGSTATIACELEESDEVRELSWRKDGVSIDFENDTKLEHVVNGLKHYLVIHDTQPYDSASYSVRINDVEFNVARMIVSDDATTLARKKAKRISNTSLQH